MRRLVNRVRPYAWGSTTAIPRLLGDHPDGQPQAELWLGAHSGAPSILQEGGAGVALDAAIAADPDPLLGREIAERFHGRLPYLLKILAAEEPLSLQAHPDSERACAGYAAEEAAGIPRDARERNYRDPYHKPELVVALEPFDALCGFREPAAALADLGGIPGRLAESLRTDLAGPDSSIALRTALTRLLTLSPQEGRASVAELAQALRVRARERAAPEESNLVCAGELERRYPGDPGSIASLLLNRVRLEPGEALFLPAGNVHAYLRGTGVEIMAGSDNVLRAGLTGKHIDVGELLGVVRFEVLPVPRVVPVPEDGWRRYPVPVDDFALWLRDPRQPGEHLPGCGPRIVLMLEGAAALRSADGRELPLEQGASAFVAAADPEPRVEGEGRMVVAAPGSP